MVEAQDIQRTWLTVGTFRRAESCFAASHPAYPDAFRLNGWAEPEEKAPRPLPEERMAASVDDTALLAVRRTPQRGRARRHRHRVTASSRWRAPITVAVGALLGLL
ncbi:hypothetical protein, partial [Accumulibacter sp.]|uniref:hypothetical protein n=1 Tax=Accumulibacter sp. TaxID=2053492 RepID=UPI002D1FB17C